MLRNLNIDSIDRNAVQTRSRLVHARVSLAIRSVLSAISSESDKGNERPE